MSEKKKEKFLEFMKELHKLCKKYNAVIGGCGCCGSPDGDVDSIGFNHLSIDTEEISWGGNIQNEK